MEHLQHLLIIVKNYFSFKKVGGLNMIYGVISLIVMLNCFVHKLKMFVQIT